MGYDPYREHRTTRLDYAFITVGSLVAVGLVLWALLG